MASHADCSHPPTREARAACRRSSGGTRAKRSQSRSEPPAGPLIDGAPMLLGWCSTGHHADVDPGQSKPCPGVIITRIPHRRHLCDCACHEGDNQ